MEESILICFNVPNGFQIGIDYYSYQVSNKFIGFKKIPKGVHFIYYSVDPNSPPICFFDCFENNDIKILEWNEKEEDFFFIKDENLLKETQLKFKRFEYNKDLGEYPLQKNKIWNKLSNFINKTLISNLEPLNKKIFPLSTEEYKKIKIFENKENDNENDKVNDKENKENDNENDKVNNKEKKENDIDNKKEIIENKTEKKIYQIYFTKIPKLIYKKGLDPKELTELNLDKSKLLNQILKDNFENKFENLLGELQFSYICFIVGQNFNGFEQWKKILDLICSCDEFWKNNQKNLILFLKALYNQLNTIEDDFFLDEISNSNFLNQLLKNFLDNLFEYEDKDVIFELKKFKNFFESKFKIKYEELLNEDELPVIVDF
jgi:A1 cistron-splicing factor AAR2